MVTNVEQQGQGIVDDEVDTDLFLMFLHPVELGGVQLQGKRINRIAIAVTSWWVKQASLLWWFGI